MYIAEGQKKVVTEFAISLFWLQVNNRGTQKKLLQNLQSAYFDPKYIVEDEKYLQKIPEFFVIVIFEP